MSEPATSLPVQKNGQEDGQTKPEEAIVREPSIESHLASCLELVLNENDKLVEQIKKLNSKLSDEQQENASHKLAEKALHEKVDALKKQIESMKKFFDSMGKAEEA